MKIPRLALAALAVWIALPQAALAEDKDKGGDEENVEERRPPRRGDKQEEGREGPGKGGRDGRGPRHEDRDPAVKEKLDKLHALERRLHELSTTLREAPPAQKAPAQAEARKVLGELFDLKLELDASMLERVEKHAAELKARIARKKAARERAIETRLARILGESDDWD